MIRSAEEVRDSVRRHRLKTAAEIRSARRAESKLRLAQELRDQTVGLIHTSKLNYEQIEELGGPVPATLKAWNSGKTKMPQIGTIASALDVLGYRLAVVAGEVQEATGDAAHAQNTLGLG